MIVEVRNGDLPGVLKALKPKLDREGVRKAMRRLEAFEKPQSADAGRQERGCTDRGRGRGQGMGGAARQTRGPTLTRASRQRLPDQRPGRGPSSPTDGRAKRGTAARDRPERRPTGRANRPTAQRPLLPGRHVGTPRGGHE